MEVSTESGAIHPFVCGLCKDTFESIQCYYKHFKSHNTYINKSFHMCDSSDTQMDSPEEMMISCKSCCGRFRTICSLHDHFIIGSNDSSYIYDDEEKCAYPLSQLCAFNSSRDDEVTEGENLAVESSTTSSTETSVTSCIKLFKKKMKTYCWLNSGLDRVREEATVNKKAVCDVATDTADLGEEDTSIGIKDVKSCPKRDRTCKKLKKVESPKKNSVINTQITRVSNRKASCHRSYRSDVITRFDGMNDNKKQKLDRKASRKKELNTKVTMKRKPRTVNGYSTPRRAEIADFHINEKKEKTLPNDADCVNVEADVGVSMSVEKIESDCDANNDDSIESDISDTAEIKPCIKAKFSETIDIRETGSVKESATKTKQKHKNNLSKQKKQRIQIVKEKKIKTTIAIDEPEAATVEFSVNDKEKKKCGEKELDLLTCEIQTLAEKKTSTAATIDESETANVEQSMTDQEKKKYGRKKVGLVTCEVCGKGVRQNKVKVHAISHSADRPYTCQRCPKTYKYPEHLAMHVKSHDDVLPFYCEVCGQGFVDVNRLKRHAFMHTSDRPYHCTICDSGFVTRYKLERHMFVHTREKKMQCDLCGMRFAHKESLNQHISSIHRKEHRFPCPECNKTFFTNYQLKCHTMKHAGVRPFKCSQCKSDFIERKELRRHMRKQHKLNLEGKNIEPGETADTSLPQATDSVLTSENQSTTSLKGRPLLHPRPGLSTCTGNIEPDFHSVNHQSNTGVQCETNAENVQKNPSVTALAVNGGVGSHGDPRETGSHLNLDGNNARLFDKDKLGTIAFDSQLKPFNFDSQVGDIYPVKEHQSYPPCVDQKVPIYPGPCLMHQPPPQLYLPMYPSQLRPRGYEALDPGPHCKDAAPMYSIAGLRPVGICDGSHVGLVKDKESYLENHSAACIPLSQGQGDTTVTSNFTML